MDSIDGAATENDVILTVACVADPHEVFEAAIRARVFPRFRLLRDFGHEALEMATFNTFLAGHVSEVSQAPADLDSLLYTSSITGPCLTRQMNVFSRATCARIHVQFEERNTSRLGAF